ncbi:hypothetical protein G4Y79_16185 [Phototrophicus methaneseepsis]|uniref:PsbP C-terminal domain-containing protein n=1 Tax=Phototrophicus methaneseepsis TaxID=2710758 RepID=A0A7S8IC73_9CHLR|nr:hypothetical protein [Phototrophicus methaneseepsis]QPC81240.1 hypothetical protein G4Y79_16185 [Phototrophicus methaneseepsis]
MIFETFTSGNEGLSQKQRWATLFTIIAGIALLLFGLIMRGQIVNAEAQYSDTRIGLRLSYPHGWLLDTAADEYVFRVRNMTRPGFKTTIQISVRPVSAATTERNVADQLARTRALSLQDYRVLSISSTTLNDIPVQAMSYTYSDQNTSPFLQSFSTVVEGLDILTIQRGQAIIITFRAEASDFEEEYIHFEQFLNTLEF